MFQVVYKSPIFINYSFLQISMQSEVKGCFDSNNADKIYQLWSMQRQIAARIQTQKINQHSILLIGDTNVGKTTLLYYLSGMKLNLIQNLSKKTKEIHPETVYQDARVTNSQSTTQVPNIFSSIPSIPSLTIVDMPGMNDTKFINALSNLFTFLSVFQNLLTKTKVHIVFVISEQIFDPQEIKANLEEIVSRFDGDGFREARNLSIIFTKTEDDEDDVKQKFVEFITEIRQQVQDEDDEVKLVQLIDFITELSQEQDFMYVFPKQSPDQHQGLRIAESIYKRDLFADNEQFMLNEMFVDNVLENEKTIVSEFQDHLIETVRQSFAQVEELVEMVVGLVRVLHKRFAIGLFENDGDLRTQLQSFYQAHSKIFQEFSPQTTIEEFQEILSFICENVPENKEIFLLDKSLIELFIEITSSNEQISIDYTIQVATRLRDCFGRIHLIFSNFKETESFAGFFKEIQNLLSWLCSQWYSNLSKVKSLQSMQEILQQCSQSLKQHNSLTWHQTLQYPNLISTLNQFSSNSLNGQSQDEQYQQQQQQIIRVQQQVADNGYYGNTVKQLKKKYMDVDSSVPRVDEVKGEVEKILKQQQRLDVRIGDIVKRLQYQVRDQVTNAQQTGMCNLTLPPQQIALTLFQMRKLRHRHFLTSALNNFTYYLKFIFFSLIQQHQQNHLLQIIQGFIENLCMILDQYSLFEQEIVLMMFAHMYGRIGKVVEKGIRGQRIGEEFVKGFLVKHVQEIVGEVSDYTMLEQLQEVITTAYGYLIAQCSSSREQAAEYQMEMSTMLTKVQNKLSVNLSKQKSQKSAKDTNFTATKPLLQPNYSILSDTPYLQLSTITDKIHLLQQRNKKPQIYQIHYHFHPQLYRSQQVISSK